MNDKLSSELMIAALKGDLIQLLHLGESGLMRPLLLGDGTLNVLGWSGSCAMPEGATWEDFIAEGIAPDFQWSEDLFETYLLPLSYGFSVCPMRRSDGSFDWLADIEMNSGQPPLHLILSGRGRPDLPPPDSELLGLVCLAIRGCINNLLRFEPYRRFSSEQLLLDLIKNENLDDPLLRFRAHEIGIKNEGYFELLMLDLRDYHPQRSSIATIRNSLNNVVIYPSVIDNEALTYLISYDTEELKEHRLLRCKVEPILKENRLFGIFSRYFYRLGDFHYHYVHTLDTLKLKCCAAPDSWLIDSEELAIYSMIDSAIKNDDISVQLHPIISILRHSDQTRKTSYVDTLSAYLRHSQKPVPTCNELHIHRNTLDYRLRRMKELADLDWEDGDLMLRLHFSLCVLKYEEFMERPVIKYPSPRRSPRK